MTPEPCREQGANPGERRCGQNSVRPRGRAAGFAQPAPEHPRLAESAQGASNGRLPAQAGRHQVLEPVFQVSLELAEDLPLRRRVHPEVAAQVMQIGVDFAAHGDWRRPT